MKKRHGLLFAVAVSVTLVCIAVIVLGNHIAAQAPPDPPTQLQSVFDTTQKSSSLTTELLMLGQQLAAITTRISIKRHDTFLGKSECK